MSQKSTKKVVLEVVERATGNVVHTLETTKLKVDKVVRGMLHQMDVERYYVREQP